MAGRHKKRKRKEVVLPKESYLDRLFIETLESGKDEDQKMKKLFGTVTADTTHIKVTIQGVCLNANKASAMANGGMYWGIGNLNNKAHRVYGKQTNARADLYSLLLALKACPEDSALEISTRSEYVIQSITEGLKEKQARGWRCTNGDLLHEIQYVIRKRQAAIHFKHIKKTTDNGHLKEAYKLAR
ncbi:hypothetical protein C8J56DRAFT_774965, partial [Mycena floridula]